MVNTQIQWVHPTGSSPEQRYTKFTFYFINVNHLFKTVPHVLAMLNLYSAQASHAESMLIDPLNIVGHGDKHPLAYTICLGRFGAAESSWTPGKSNIN